MVSMGSLLLIAGLTIADPAADDASRSAILPESRLLFREDWKTTPAEQPITQEHVANEGLRLGLHGPGKGSIKKSHHDQPADDPYYLWSGQCQTRWAFSLRPAKYLIDLSSEDAKLRLRTKQSGGHELYVLLKLPGEQWYVSSESIPTTSDWQEFELMVSDLTWHRFDITTIAREAQASPQSLAKIEEIGLTDLRVGAGSGACSRVDWVEVWGNQSWPALD